MGYLIYLLLGLIIISVVGHGLWVAIAWVLRGGRPRDTRAAEPTLSDDRAATARYLEHLRTSERIDQAMHGRLMNLIAEDVRLDGELPYDDRGLAPAERTETQAREVDRSPEEPFVLMEATSLFKPVARMPQPLAEVEAEAPPSTTFSSPAEPELPPSEPRRPLASVLLTFMAEKNIRWGELIGGLLILCCSTALVISLWSRIEAIPVMRFLIFTAVTAALFGTGLFVHHRWRLPTTGRAILVIASLLVPLNLLVFAALSPPGRAVGGGMLSVELVAVGLFGLLTWLAGRVVIPMAPVRFAGGVVILSAASLLIRFLSPLADARIAWVGLLPVGPLVILMGMSLWSASRLRSVTEELARQLFLQLGVHTFACLAPIGLLFYGAGHTIRAFHLLSPLLCAMVGPSLVTGLLLSRRLERRAPSSTRLTATSISMVAAGLLVLGVGLAWPVPSRLMTAVLVNAAVMIAATRVIRHPAIHGAAVLWLSAAWVLAVQLLCGHVAWHTDVSEIVRRALLSAGTGQALVAAVLASAASAAWLHHRRRYVLGAGYGMGALVLAAISLILVTLLGFGARVEAPNVTWVYLLYGLAAFVAAERLRSPHVCWAGGLLVQIAIVQGLVYTWPLRQYAWPTALLVGATACALATVAMSLLRQGQQRISNHFSPLARMAIFLPLLAAVWMLITAPWSSIAALSPRMLWVAVLWGALAVARESAPVFTASQVALAVAACAAVQQYLSGLPWYASFLSSFRDPRTWQAHAIVINALCLVWTLIRIAMSRWSSAPAADSMEGERPSGGREIRLRLTRFLDPGARRIATDRYMLIVALYALVMLAIWGVGPGIVAEHARPSSTALSRELSHAVGIGSWCLLLMLIATLSLHMWEGFHITAVAGLLIATAGGVSLLAGRFGGQGHTLSIVRWCAASVFLGLSAAFWTRPWWSDRVSRLARLRPVREVLTPDLVRLLLMALFALPVVLLSITLMTAICHAGAMPRVGLSDAWLCISLLGPMIVLIISLMGYSLVEQRPDYAIAAAVLASIATTGTVLSVVGRTGRWVTLELLVYLAQLNAIVMSVVPILRRVVQFMVWPGSAGRDYPRRLLTICRVAIGVTLFAAIVAIGIQPRTVPALVDTVGAIWGFLAVLLVECALLTRCQPPAAGRHDHREGVWAAFGMVLLACALRRFDTGNWLCFHALMVGFVVAGWAALYAGHRQVRQLLGAGWQETFDAASARAGGQAGRIEHDVSCTQCGYNLRGLEPSGKCPECGTTIGASIEAAVSRLTPQWASLSAHTRSLTIRAVLACTLLGTVFAMRAVFDDPQRPWWSTAVMAALSLLCMALAGWAPRGILAYLGGVELCMAADVWWITGHRLIAADSFIFGPMNLIHVNIVALSLAGIIWFLIDRYAIRWRSTAEGVGLTTAFHHVAAAISTALVMFLTGVLLLWAAEGESLHPTVLWSWLAWGMALVLLLACSTERGIRQASAGLYVLGLAGFGRIMAHTGVTPRTLAWAMSLGLAGHVLVTTLVSRYWPRIVRREPAQGETASWLLFANSVLAIVSVGVALFASVTQPDIIYRMLVVLSPAVCGASAVLLVAGRRQTLMQTSAAAMWAVAAVLLAWSFVPPNDPAGVLHRAVGLVTALAGMTVVFALAGLLAAPGQSWATAIAQCVVGVQVMVGAGLLYTAGSEVRCLLNHQTVPLAGTAITALIVAIVLVIVCCILFATRERLDPLRLNPRNKELYVYAAEVLAGLLGLHVRATMPHLFSGLLMHYWPILLIFLAFAAVTAGEVCDRYGRRVLARPFGRTGLFLPLLALPELFIASSRVHYSVVLLTIGVLYGVLARFRRSIVLAGLSGLSLCGSLWYLLGHTQGLGILEHPQLWFIPPSLAVLAAGHLNRSRLSDLQRRTVHYAGLFAIYMSSTADVFLIGVARAPWLPLVLGGLSVVGIFVGIASRVRSFLLLGTGFLSLSLLTMIWHAAANLGWTWVWYVAGIALGAAIITIFALFEKKRSQMTALIEQVKDWAD